jgi:hypothetical protein
MSSPRWVPDRLPRFDSIWPCEGNFGAVKEGLTAARLVVSTTCEACALATASFGRKQAGRCTGASSPTAAVRSRDLHLPRCFHRRAARASRAKPRLLHDPSMTDLRQPTRPSSARHELRCAVCSAELSRAFVVRPMRRRQRRTRFEVRAGVRLDRGPANRLLEGRWVSGSAGIP